jgi:hypothetical protein
VDSWLKPLEALAAGGFPWLSQLRALNIHFAPQGVDVKGILNFFASLFAVAAYGYCTYASPHQLLFLPPWWLFVAMAFVMSFAYFSLFLYARGRVNAGSARWPILVAFPLYVLLFSSVTLGFGLLKLYENNLVVTGRVTDSADDHPVPLVTVAITDTARFHATAETDAHGRFLLVVPKDVAKGTLRVSAGGQPDYFPELKTVDGEWDLTEYCKRLRIARRRS